jgi:hypothetical protein
MKETAVAPSSLRLPIGLAFFGFVLGGIFANPSSSAKILSV